MRETFRFHDPKAVRRPAALGLASLVLLWIAAAGCAHGGCPQVPTDAYSERIDALLTEVEGPGFPSADNLAGWNERRGDIQMAFGEILGLTEDDPERRKQALHALLAAESLSASPGQASEVTGSEGGEVRAWARYVLRGYSVIGVKSGDRRLAGGEIIDGLQASWETDDHPQRGLALYQQKAAALRGLARYEPSPACEKQP